VSLSGAVGAGIAHITETCPTVIGKPSVVSMEAIAARTGVDIPGVLVVGDDVDVEIVMGRAAGAPTVLVLSGTTGEKPREEIDRLDGDRRPDLVIPDVGHLFSVLPALAVGTR
jgi:4-nitrophenyl phosphatase